MTKEIVGGQPGWGTIENQIWEKDPDNPDFLRYVGQRPAKEILRELANALDTMGLLPEEYFSCELPEGALFPLSRWIACYPVTGTNEGWYIHVDAITFPKDPSSPSPRILVFLGKTFRGFEFAARAAAKCAELLGA